VQHFFVFLAHIVFLTGELFEGLGVIGERFKPLIEVNIGRLQRSHFLLQFGLAFFQLKIGKYPVGADLTCGYKGQQTGTHQYIE